MSWDTFLFGGGKAGGNDCGKKANPKIKRNILKGSVKRGTNIKPVTFFEMLPRGTSLTDRDGGSYAGLDTEKNRLIMLSHLRLFC